MDIKRAKQEIENTVRAYLATDDTGAPLIPAIRQAAHPADGARPASAKPKLWSRLHRNAALPWLLTQSPTTPGRAPWACLSSASATMAGPTAV